MFKALARYILVSFHTFYEGLTLILFENIEIVNMNFLVKERVKTPSEEQKILVKYLENCKKQTCKDTNGKKRSTEETNRQTKKIL